MRPLETKATRDASPAFREVRLAIPDGLSSFREGGFREEGAEFRNTILDKWGEADGFVFDFKGRAIASTGFMDEAFGKLYPKLGEKGVAAKPLRFENILPLDRQILRDILILRRDELRRDEARGKTGKAVATYAQIVGSLLTGKIGNQNERLEEPTGPDRGTTNER